MKKCLTALSAVLLAAMLMVSLVACGSDSGSNSNAIVGTWVASEMDMGNGSKVSLDSLTGGSEELQIKMAFDNDGNVTLTAMGQDIKGTYAVKDSKVEIKYESGGTSVTESYDFNGTELSQKDSNTGMTIYLKKQ